ncbi:hypothetical protein PV325_001232 [Microctonus aethiopoides]|uniref:tRNA (guanine-N(7)-)-methyltransferase non-catalytic subunit wuho n=1 Tax=Microctonus aethiopoides TaxID=144406 RepID=A0AA39FJ74_9HYME|nr:hypothetical protein PV325_001232 [Microctonus aethiopoides]KAK0096577.1 hypothetical protein PV326_005073 [Microctonus aethiopoides]KAK0170401.1 hypothetical protein PV328_010969 [Microctonus aethiopoides]
MSFSVFNSNIILCSSENVFMYNYKNNTESIIELGKLIISENLKQHNNSDIDTCHGITSVKFSSNGDYFLICTNRKQLCVYKSCDCSLILNTTLTRAASQVEFTPNNDIVVADKSGDVYMYYNDSNKYSSAQQGTLIVGHLSMLLDVLVTHDNKYVITADRDEKIRVSKFPNAYNIESYCLGHRAFVTNIRQLPHDENILVSAGGDGELKFWDYKNGRELKSISYDNKINEGDVIKLYNNLEELDLKQVVTTLPAKHLCVMKWNENSSILISSFYGSGNILMYYISGNVANNNVNAEFKQIVVEDTEPLECRLQDQQLWLLYDNKLVVYEIKPDFTFEYSQINNNLIKLNKSWSLLRSQVKNQSFYPILYKRKFDNVQEYQERKKSRLMNVL